MCAEVVHKIFVSGTFHDIRDIRDVVQRVLSEQKVRPVDLSGEDERSRAVKTLIDKELDTSDFYICILGERYGSRVNDVPTAPSWTHYEFERFLARESASDGEQAMMILEPKRPSRAYDYCRRKAEEVYDMQKLDPAERSRDASSQSFFKRLITGGKIDPPDPDLIDLDNAFVPIPIERACRTPGAQFRNAEEIEIALLRFMLREDFIYSRKVHREPAPSASAPAIATAVKFPQSIADRLAPRPTLPALCAITARLDDRGLTANAIGEALVAEGYWTDVDKRVLNVLDVTDPTADRILQVMAQLEFGADVVPDRAGQIAAIAKEVAADPFRRTYHVYNIEHFGIAKAFLQDIWPKLQKEIAQRTQSAQDRGLLLILSCDLAPDNLQDYCQPPDAKKFNPSKPILLTESALFPDAPAPTPSTSREATRR